MKTPNFEQYKKDQQKIEAIPTIKPDFHLIVNDCAKKILENQELSEKEIADLEIVYQMVQDIERELLTFLDNARSQEIISKWEFLAAMDYFLTANQQGPDSGDMKLDFMETTITPEDFKQAYAEISIPGHTKTLLNVLYEKIHTGKLPA